MTTRNERRIVWGVYGLAIATAVVATPFVLALADWFRGLILLWGPLLVVAVTVYGVSRERSEPLSASPQPLISSERRNVRASLALLLLLLDGYILYLSFPLIALHYEPNIRGWMVTMLAILLVASVSAPSTQTMRAPDRGLARWLILRSRWILPGTIATALFIATTSPNPSHAFVVINVYPALWFWLTSREAPDDK